MTKGEILSVIKENMPEGAEIAKTAVMHKSLCVFFTWQPQPEWKRQEQLVVSGLFEFGGTIERIKQRLYLVTRVADNAIRYADA